MQLYSPRQYLASPIKIWVNVCYCTFVSFRKNTVPTHPSFTRDVFNVLFSSRQFFANRFMSVTSRRLFFMGFWGTFLGLLVGSLVSLVFAESVTADLMKNQELYTNALQTLGLSEPAFLDLMKAQKAYSMLMAILSPLIAYMAPHIFGGALYIFLWLLLRPTNTAISFSRVMDCSSAALTSMAWYILPTFGPFIALVMVGLNVSRALFQQYQLVGFLKVMSVISAIYISFFLSSASLQLVAKPLMEILKG